MAILSSPDEPFGLLEPLHRYILRTATPLTWTNWPFLFVVPLMPMGVLCFLALYPNTRPYRIPIGVAGLSMLIHALLSYRFETVEYNAFNNGIGISAMHLAAKYIEFALIEGPVVDPYVARGSRSKLLAAIDLPINSRMVGLGRIKVNQRDKEDSSNDPVSADGGVEMDRQVTSHRQERWLPYTAHPGRSRARATLRHATHTVVHYLVFDYLLALMWNFGESTIGNPHGVPGAVESFLDTKQFVLFPHSAKPVPVATLVVEIIMELSLAAGVWQGISMGYHSFASLAVGSGLWETASWEVDIFDAPWKADSILDVWGRRWHQIFRHHFLLTSSMTLNFLGLPATPALMLPLIFFFSGAMHGLGQISMSPVPNPSRLAFFFILSGVGGALEAAFRKVTGRRVRGIWGRLWTWSWLLYTGRWAARTWLDGGIGGSRLVPTDIGLRPGPILVDLTTRYIFDTTK